MKTVTTAFKDAQKSPMAVSVRRVSYKRRYWVESSHAYTWESSWTVLPENEIVSVSPITGKLDTDKLNEFKISNVNLVLKNELRQWKAGKRGGYFGATTAYPDGFEPYWTKFKIESGYEVSGVATYVPLFVGVATGFSTSAASDTIQVDVRGLEALLENANAENVSTLVTAENIGTGNGSNKDFTTVHPGAGIIKEVTVDWILKKAGVDYSISQLNDPTLGGKISFTTAPTAGAIVRITYRYWKQDVTIESVVKDLLTEAGISTPYQMVDGVILDAGAITKQTEGTQADFDAGTYDKTEGYTSPGSIKLNFRNSELLDDFSDGNYTTNPTWFTTYGSWSIVGNKATTSTPSFGLFTNNSRAFGEWGLTSNIPYPGGYMEFFFIANSINGSQYLSDGWFISKFINYSYAEWKIGRVYGTSIPPNRETVATFSNVLSNPSVIRISRNPNGVHEIFIGGTKVYSVNLNGYTLYPTTSYIGLVGDGTFDDIYIPSATITGTHTSRSINLGFPAVSYGNINSTGTLNGGSISFETRTSTDGVSWDGWLPVSGSISSTPRQYIQVRSTLTSLSPSTISPVLDQYEFQYTASSTKIKLANMTDQTCYGAIQRLGSFANYEWGFGGSEIFFFRKKQTDKIAEESIDASTNLTELSNMSDGTERVFSEVQATFGSYDITVGDDGIKKTGPLARFGKRRFTVDGGDILLPPDVDVASGIASSFYESLKYPKKTMKVRTKMMEWLDLSDTVSVTFNDNIPARPWTFGDTSVNFGDQSLYYFGDADQTAKNMLCKVVGYRHDTENKTSEFDLEEII